MGRIRSKVDDLVEEDSSMVDALESILDVQSDNGDGEVEWSDVRDDLSSGQWGRLIEKGVLVDGETGFRLADQDDVEAALEERNGSTVSTSSSSSADEDEDEESGGWRTIDKLAAVAAFGMILGYSIQPVKNTVGGAVDLVFGPIQSALPFYLVIMLAAMITASLSTIAQSQMMDQSKMSQSQEKAQELKERRERAKERGDDEELKRIQEEQMAMMSDQMGMMAENFRPTVWIMLVTIPIFLWIYWQIGNFDPVPTMVMPIYGEVDWNSSAALWFPAWVFWYILNSIAFSNMVRKAIGFRMSPS
jgi:uncharacterized membrane protein (DUF106 family)